MGCKSRTSLDPLRALLRARLVPHLSALVRFGAPHLLAKRQILMTHQDRPPNSVYHDPPGPTSSRAPKKGRVRSMSGATTAERAGPEAEGRFGSRPEVWGWPPCGRGGVCIFLGAKHLSSCWQIRTRVLVKLGLRWKVT